MANRFAIVLASGSGIAAGLASKNRVSAANNFIMAPSAKRRGMTKHSVLESDHAMIVIETAGYP